MNWLQNWKLNRDIKQYNRNHPRDCSNGNHVPVKLLDANGNIEDVRCQNCGIEMTETDWDYYFLESDFASIWKRLNEFYGRTESGIS